MARLYDQHLLDKFFNFCLLDKMVFVWPLVGGSEFGLRGI